MALDKHALVRVTWDDAEDPNDGKTWLDADDVQQFSEATCLVVSVGHLIRQTPRYVTLGADYIEKLGHYGRVTKIPASMVQRLERLVPQEEETE